MVVYWYIFGGEIDLGDFNTVDGDSENGVAHRLRVISVDAASTVESSNHGYSLGVAL